MREYWRVFLRWLPGGVGALLLIGTRLAEFKGWVSPNAGIGLVALAYALVLVAISLEGWRAIRQPAIKHLSIPQSAPSVVMLGLLWMGTALRLHYLGKAPLWFDELWSVYISKAPTLLDMPDRLPMNWTPTHPAILMLQRPLFGDSEFALRWPSAAAGVIAIAATYALGKRLYSQRASTLAAGLLTVSLPFVSYSQEARTYSLLVMAAILCSAAWLDLLRRFDAGERPTLSLVLCYIGLALLMISSHFVGLVILVIQAVMLTLRFIRAPHKLSDISIIYTAIGFGFALIILPNFARSFANGFQRLGWIPAVGAVHKVLAEYLAMPFGYSRVRMVAVYGLAGISIATLVWRGRWEWMPRGSFGTVYLLIWWIAPFIAVYLVSIWVQPLWHERYVLAMLPPVLLLISEAISHLPLGRLFHGVLAIALVAGLGSTLVIENGYYASKNESLGYRTGVWALQEVLEDDPNTIWGWISQYGAVAFESYLTRYDIVDPPLGGYNQLDIVQMIETLDAAMEQSKPSTIWLVYFGEGHNELTFLIEQSHWKLTLIEKRTYDRTSLWHFRVEPRTATTTQ